MGAPSEEWLVYHVFAINACDQVQPEHVLRPLASVKG